ncbi:Gfo/Idh/MocA family protein [Terriglobus roseus]|uniref:Predicted dehydrogenase n=1 Tax=Terriglobus roseus TaxID=392734 RepID=A0A1H4JLD6_9BACT|nr:Gfo/Idh/MocA family oxidoreductase [Terriglobus roseus]SEB47083.1 Predicted dehydrogenase [Terriglobus roseus]
MTTKLNRRLRLGMVGGGPGAFIGAVHRTAARIDDRFELVAAVLSSDGEKSRAYAAELRIPRAYASFQEMADAEAKHPEPIDVVAIVTPNHMHHAIARAFLAAGIHVMCDKPLTTNLADADDLAAAVAASGLIFGVTQSYSGYPMVRQMREIVTSGGIGAVRMVQAEYAQGWLATKLEDTGAKQAAWRTDPAKSGPAGCLGDIATHAFHTACFVTGLKPKEVAADLSTFVAGRRLDDNVQAMLHFEGGAKASLWSSQIAIGEENNLNIRIYGETGALTWHQENPNYVHHAPLGEPTRLLTRGGAGVTASPAAGTRLPTGHPEGYFEAFATLYSDLAEQIAARIEGREANASSLLLPTVADGVAGVRFIEAVLKSSANSSAWTPLT